MTEEKQQVVYRGTSSTSLLTILFVGLKLTGVINWSWWWVLSPLWIPLAVVIAILTIFGLVYAIVLACRYEKPKSFTKLKVQPKSKFQEKIEKWS